MSKTVIITGASKGIGAATAITFAEKGYNVVLNYNNSFENVRLLSSSLQNRGFNVMPFKADVTNSLETDLMVKETVDKFGAVDILVNNAGVAIGGLITELDVHDSDKIFAVNLKGTYNASKSVIPTLVNQKSGKIINVSSMWGVTGASCESAYSASKAGVIGLTKALAKELAPSGITVNCVAPGLIETGMNAHLSEEELKDFIDTIPLGRIGKPEEIAAAIYFLASSEADYITGQVLNVNGGYVI